jgi:hypothetical protein
MINSLLQLKVYATDTIPIPDEYDPRAETAVSIKERHTSKSTASGYILFNFIIFPIFTWLVLLVVFMYINTCAQEPRLKKLKSILEGNDEDKTLVCKHQLQNEFTLSLMFVLLSTSLAAAAVIVGVRDDTSEDKYVSDFYTNKQEEPIQFRRIFALGYVVLILDFLILVAMLMCAILSKCISEKLSELISKCPTLIKWMLDNLSKWTPKCLSKVISKCEKHEEREELKRKLVAATNRLVAAAMRIPSNQSAAATVSAASKLQEGVIQWARKEMDTTIEKKIASAKEQMLYLEENVFNGLKEAQLSLQAVVTASEGNRNALREIRMEEVSELDTELERLKKYSNHLKASITDITNLSTKILKQLTREETLIIVNPARPNQRELGEISNISSDRFDEFGTAAWSLQNPTKTLTNNIMRIPAAVEQKISDPIHNLNQENIDPLIREVKQLVARVTTHQTQVNHLALTVSSLAEAATTLTKVSEGKVDQQEAVNALIRAITSLNAVKLTVATSPLVVELIDTVSMKNNLGDLEKSLTSAKNDTDLRLSMETWCSYRT